MHSFSLLFKSLFFAAFIVFFGWLAFSPTISHPERFFLESNGTPCPALKDLFSIIGIPVPKNAEELASSMHKYFRRPNKLERWELSDSFENKRRRLMALFTLWHMVEEIWPKQKYYDTVVVQGSTVENARDRFSYLMRLWHKGIRFQRIVVLASDRPLDPRVEGDMVLFNAFRTKYPFRKDWKKPIIRPQTELDAMEMLWNQMILDDSLHKMPVQFLEIPQVLDESLGHKRRPYAPERVYMWVERWLAKETIAPASKKSYLVIANNPMLAYHEITLRTIFGAKGLLEQGYTVEVVGLAAKENTKMTVFLDTLARTLEIAIQNSNRKKLKDPQKKEGKAKK